MRYLLCYVLLLIGLLPPFALRAQDDLMGMLEEMEEPQTVFTQATFKAVRILNAHSVESPAPGVMTMIISHRFGRLNGGAYELFGLDQANIRIGLDYGITPWWSVGVGRSNIRKTYDGFTKVKLLRQSTGTRRMPLTVAYVGGMQLNSLRWAEPDRENYFTSRLSYSHQLLIARKFNENFSLQLMPSMVHRNLVERIEEDNDVFSLGVGGRMKITPSMTVNFEYFYLLPSYTADNFTNSLSLGIDIETGGHVFQLVFSNSVAMTENLFIAETDGEWGLGDIHFGFNITRVFNVGKKRK